MARAGGDNDGKRPFKGGGDSLGKRCLRGAWRNRSGE